MSSEENVNGQTKVEHAEEDTVTDKKGGLVKDVEIAIADDHTYSETSHRSGCNPCLKLGLCIETLRQSLYKLYSRNKGRSIYALKIGLLIGFCVYVVFACLYDLEGAAGLLVLSGLILVYCVWLGVKRTCLQRIRTSGVKLKRKLRGPCLVWIIRLLYLLFPLGFCGLLVFVGLTRPANLVSALGLLVCLLAVYLTSRHPAKVVWRPVLWGLTLQLILGVLILRWRPGYQVFRFLGAQVEAFAAYTDEGSKFIFGDPQYKMHQVAFVILPVVIFFSSFISILYYLGIMQWLVRQVAVVMQYTMGTTAVESLFAAASIFLGQLECAVMFKPFLGALTESELFSIMTVGFTTVAGTVMAAYIEFGAPAEHVISAAIMSAPAAMAIAKLQLPETEHSTTKRQEDIVLPKSEAHNVIEAACNGAIQALKLCAVLVAVFICFLPLLAFVNAILSFVGGRVGYPEFSMDLIFTYLFTPMAWLVGIDLPDIQKIGRLIGVKIVLQEFLAFSYLKPLVDAKAITQRSRVIATYFLSGFGSVPSVGIFMSSLIAMVPSKRDVFAKLALRAMICSNVACMMTASIAGLLYDGDVETSLASQVNTTQVPFNTTLPANATYLLASN